jgi:serine/threonine-protein kinase
MSEMPASPTPVSPSSASAGSPPPPEIPGYQILQVIGIGGTSTVYKAKQSSLDRTVALKVLSPSLARDQAARDAFRRESQLASQIRHPAIAAIVDAGEANGFLYYAMDFIDGSPLSEVVKSGPLPPKEVIKIGRIVTDVLGKVFAQLGLLHGDLKPGNLMLARDGSLHLMDFGLARLTAITPSMLEDFDGTPTYLAPEILAGEPQDVASDIYSLGLTLYHLATGIAPFEGYSVEQLLEAQSNDFLPDPIAMNASVPLGFAQLLCKMTAKSPAERPGGWDALARDFASVEAGRRPAPPIPGEAASTILLDESHRPSPRENRAGTIRVTQAAQRRAAAPVAKSSGIGVWIGWTVVFLLLLLGASLAVYFDAWGWIQKQMHPAVPAAFDKDTPRSHKSDATAAAPAAKPAETADAAPLDPAVTRGTLVEGAWNDDGYVAAAKRFNAALARYLAATNQPENNPVGREVASEARAAAAQLESRLPDCPPDMPLLDYLTACYQLARDGERMALSRREKAFLADKAKKSRNESLAPWPVPEKTNDPFGAYMDLGYAWEAMFAPEDAREATDFVMLLSDHVRADCATRADPNQMLYLGVKWLAPRKDVLKTFKCAALPVREPVPSRLFPYGGAFLTRVALPEGSALGTLRVGPTESVRYKEALIVSDARDRVIALELLDGSPDGETVAPTSSFTPQYLTEDFVTASMVPENGDRLVAYTIRPSEKLLRIDEETMDANTFKPVRRSSLLLPRGVANVLAYHVMGK